jgi:hypothetical protein
VHSYKYEQELSARESSEILVSQMKDQVARTESRLSQLDDTQLNKRTIMNKLVITGFVYMYC